MWGVGEFCRSIIVKKTLFAAGMFVLCVAVFSGCRKKADPGAAPAPRPEVHAAASQPEPPQTDDSARPADVPAPPADMPAGKIALKILYAGRKGTDRAWDFAEFLKANFAEVGEGDYAAFQPEQAAGFDVVVLDYDGVALNAPRLNLPPDYARATLTLGVPGADLGSQLNLKTGYL
jgi:hypothetical protein